jgi:mRNA-degrading endonuclease RelE of RelBE toxin-antitoxin system
MSARKRLVLQISDDAEKDLRRLKKLDVSLASIALRLLQQIGTRAVVGIPLEHLPKFGDLSDCRKVYFGYGSPPTHRIVYRIVDETVIEIVDVIAVETRDDAYIYLLTALRLQRLPKETQPEYQSVHQRMIASRSAKKVKKS